MTQTGIPSLRERSGRPSLPRYRFAVLVLTILSIVGLSLVARAETLPDWWKVGEDTPGMRLTAQVEKRSKKDPFGGGHKSVTIKLSPSGYPKYKEYELWLGRLNREPERVMNLEVDADGRLRIVLPRTYELGRPLSEMPITLSRFAKGEAAVIAVVSTDRGSKAFLKFFPFPLEATDHGCRIWMELASRDGNAFVVQGEGFEPGEEVSTLSRSDGERLPATQKITPDGALAPVLLFPETFSRRQSASYSVKGRSCSVEIKYRWGPSALKVE